MRLVAISALAALACMLSVTVTHVVAAAAADCTGENCPPPDHGGGHDCHDKEQTTS